MRRLINNPQFAETSAQKFNRVQDKCDFLKAKFDRLILAFDRAQDFLDMYELDAAEAEMDEAINKEVMGRN